MNAVKVNAALIAVLLMILLYSCGHQVAGGSSDTEVSAMISGTVVDALGQPVSHARVRLRPSEYLPGGQNDSLTALFSTHECFTDRHGLYSIDSVERGEYCVEIAYGDSIGVVQTIEVDSSVTLDAKLEPFGRVSGNLEVFTNLKNNYATSKVQLYGTEYCFNPDSNGHFFFPLPAGNHRMKFTYDSSEMVINMKVEPSQYHDFGTLHLNTPPYTCMEYTCDSLTLRKFLDDAGHADIPVESVSKRAFGRIGELNLRGIKISITLAPLNMLNAVRKIDLGNTGITDSCRFVAGMWNLEVLLIDSNAITGLSRYVEGLFNLKQLDVSDNLLTKLPDYISNLRLDNGLDLSNNRLCELQFFLLPWADRFDPDWKELQICQLSRR